MKHLYEIYIKLKKKVKTVFLRIFRKKGGRWIGLFNSESFCHQRFGSTNALKTITRFMEYLEKIEKGRVYQGREYPSPQLRRRKAR